ncbi:MAG: glycosyltransferase family 2 protein [Clostridiales bacterium]|nr:glycosyltransferase family 2 protein [Clostridiales bacterium]
MATLSVVIPSYNEEKMVPITARTISSLLQDAGISFELLFVDDGSNDRTWEEIEHAATIPSQCIHGVHFSRNFGKEAAIMAGLSEAVGDCCVVIDCDLQHPPEKIIEMYHLWEEGYEVVEGVKSSRGSESGLHRFAAHSFYSLISSATGFDMENASDFKLLDRKAVDVITHMREKNAFFRALSSWVGFKTTTVSFDVQERMEGESKWSTASLVKYAVRNIASFSTAPMQIVTFLGVLMLVVSVVMGIVSLVQKILGMALGGFTTVIILQLFSSSIIMISIGIVGYYIARIFEEVKNRPPVYYQQNLR